MQKPVWCAGRALRHLGREMIIVTRLLLVGTVAFYTLTGCGWEPPPQEPGLRTETARFAVTHTVPGDFASVWEALHHAAAGDTVEIAEGVYDRGGDVRRRITIRGAGMGRTVIHGSIFIEEWPYQNVFSNIVARCVCPFTE